MERLLFLWDELDDWMGLAKHFGRNLSGNAQASFRGAMAGLRASTHRSIYTSRLRLTRSSGRSGLKFRSAAPNFPRR
jgi:hypothetical protein